MTNCQILQPTPLYVRNGRSSTIARVEGVIQRAFNKKYRVQVFGSTAYGVDTLTSDLDLVVIVRSCVHLI
jgi:predicted nucleotidyltransferase